MRSQHFASLVAKQPENELFRFSLAQALMAEQRPAEAIEHLRLCAARRADWMVPRIMLGRALAGLGQREEAGRWLEDALRLAIEQHHEEPEADIRRLLAELQPHNGAG